MEILRASRNWSGPPLALQIVGLLLGGLVVAQLVTLFLTLVLPPEPQPQYGLGEIARALSGESLNPGKGRPLQRAVQAGPPALQGPGWLTSDRSRHDLARLLGRDDADVQLYFFTPLPFAGVTQLPERRAGIALPERYADIAPPKSVHESSEGEAAAERPRLPPGFMFASYRVAQNATTAGAFPGGGFPGGFPGGGYPGAGLPSGGFPASGVPRSVIPDVMRTPPVSTQPVTPPTPATTTAPTVTTAPASVQPVTPDTASGAALPSVLSVPQAVRIPAVTRPDLPNFVPGGLPQIMSVRPVVPPVPAIVSVPGIGGIATHIPAQQPVRQKPAATMAEHTAPPLQAAPAARPAAPPPEPRLATAAPIPAPAPPAAKPLVHEKSPPAAAPVALPAPRGLFGLAPVPFVEGDFVAALRMDDGRWAVVKPVPEPFPNSWQRRVLLWFLISFALVAPLGWLFARRLVRPIAGFAHAAEQLGRDPTAPIMPLEGPAEVGRAAHAFNRMQSRLRSFVDDRTAMVGAISHDLRTPLTRLRFRLEDVPDELREPMLAEVDEMEQMISSVLAFIRDASEPGSREMLDLRSIVEDVVEDAVFVGKPVTLEESERAPVEVDPLGMRRLLGNLVENAVKYGDRARVRLFTDRQDAVAEILDNGPGLPDEELERVFQPFYRAPAARQSNKHGTGLGLAVCRSIARAHGGDVKLRRGDHGLVAQVRLPLAYGMTNS